MSSNRKNQGQRLALVLLAVAVTPLVAGCSTLGIAEVKDMDAMNRRLTSANTTTNDQVQQLTTQLDGIDTRLDSMNTDLKAAEEQVRETNEFLQGLNLAEISGQADRAAAAAVRAEQHFDGLLSQYLRRLRADQAGILQEIKDVEAKLEASRADRKGGQSGGAAAAKAAPDPADSEPLPEIPSGD